MPIYDVYHVTPLSMEQRDQLAEGITKIHAEKFTAPRLFVNVAFHDDTDRHTYVAGKRKSSNRIVATVRSGPSRTSDMWDDICVEVTKLWNGVLGTDNPRHELRAIFVLGSLIAGAEAGYSLPKAGEDKAWISRNLESFKEKADAGDEDFVDLIKELKVREEFHDLVGDWKSEPEVKEEKEKEKEKKKEEQV